MRSNSIRVEQKSANIDSLELTFVERARPSIREGECLIEVSSAGVNPSDVKAVLGFMPHAVWPRTPGRDYAGVVLDGPDDLIGRNVWGSGGELGIRVDGTHGRFLVTQAAGVRCKPTRLTMEEAGAIGVPFITAHEGLRRAGGVKAGDVVLVLGMNGKVGQAVTQLATRVGARVFGVERTRQPYIGHANGEVRAIDASTESISEVVRRETGGKGADIVFNSVGSPYFEEANRAMAVGATQVFISTIDRAVPFDIFTFYRGQHTYVGVDTLALDSVAGAHILDTLWPAFEDGTLRPFPIATDHVFPLERAADAYRAVLNGAKNRVLIKP